MQGMKIKGLCAGDEGMKVRGLCAGDEGQGDVCRG